MTRITWDQTWDGNVKCRRGQAAGILVCLEHERRYRTEEHGFGYTLRAMAAQVASKVRTNNCF
jgi:hypothetical protein